MLNNALIPTPTLITKIKGLYDGCQAWWIDVHGSILDRPCDRVAAASVTLHGTYIYMGGWVGGCVHHILIGRGLTLVASGTSTRSLMGCSSSLLAATRTTYLIYADVRNCGDVILYIKGVWAGLRTTALWLYGSAGRVRDKHSSVGGVCTLALLGLSLLGRTRRT